MARSVLLGVCALCALAAPAPAVIHVPADQPTIQAALDQARLLGEEVIVAPGTYSGPGNVNLDFKNKPTLLRSSGGPGVTVIDCEGTAQGIKDTVNSTAGWQLRGFTVTNGRGRNYRGSAGEISTFGIITIEDCVFRDNGAGGGSRIMEGGALWLAGGTFNITDCVFRDNAAGGRGGALYIGSGTHTITRCRFEHNDSEFRGGAVSAVGNGTLVNIDECVFWNNHALNWGGALYVSTGDTNIDVTQSTFVGNSAAFGSLGWNWSPTGVMSFSHSIIASGVGSEVIFCQAPTGAVLTCSNVFGNAGGDWVGCLAGQDNGVAGNFSADPSFCDPGNGVFTISLGSPCAPPGITGCGLVGALTTACGPVSVEPSSWGKVKSHYRGKNVR